MNGRRSIKWWGWILVILVIALLGAGLWIRFQSAADLLGGGFDPDYPCNSDEPVLYVPIYPIAELAVDEQSIYWIIRGNPGSVMELSKSSGEFQVLADVQAEPYGFLADDRSVFWVEGTWEPDLNFILKKVDKRSGEVTELWQARGSMTQLSMDTDYLYWLDDEAKAVLSISKKGGEPEALVSGVEGLQNFTILNGKTYLGGGDWLGLLEGGSPRILITTDQLIQELHISLRDERSIYFAGPVIGEYKDETIFEFYVGNYPGMISCTDNAAHLVGLPEAGGTPHIIMSVEGSLSNADMIAPSLYSVGVCRGGQVVDLDTGEMVAVNIGYDAFNLAVDKSYLYWSDREGLKCMRRPISLPSSP